MCSPNFVHFRSTSWLIILLMRVGKVLEEFLLSISIAISMCIVMHVIIHDTYLVDWTMESGSQQFRETETKNGSSLHEFTGSVS